MAGTGYPVPDQAVDRGRVFELKEVADPGNRFKTASRRQAVRVHPPDLHLGAAIVFSVEVEGGGERLHGGQLPYVTGQGVPVIAECGPPPARSFQRFEDPGQVLVGLVSGRPVAPELRNQPPQAAFAFRELIEEEVPAHPELAEGNRKRVQ